MGMWMRGSKCGRPSEVDKTRVVPRGWPEIKAMALGSSVSVGLYKQPSQDAAAVLDKPHFDLAVA